jgi:outer membrane protein assembly factor BamB
MDGEKNIYLTCSEGIRKFSPDGKLMWEYASSQPGYALLSEITTTAGLWNGMVFSSTTMCELFALDMATGKQVWKVIMADRCSADSGFTVVHKGVLIQASDVAENSDCAKTKVQARNATNGDLLWKFSPDAPTWSFLPHFAGDGTFVFQDMEGRAYRHTVSDGSRIWAAGGTPGSWTDGQSLLGFNGIVYATERFEPQAALDVESPGRLTAYSFESGTMLWSNRLPLSPNQAPALGKLRGHSGLSIVQPVGSQCQQGAHYDVYTLLTLLQASGSGYSTAPCSRVLCHARTLRAPK